MFENFNFENKKYVSIYYYLTTNYLLAIASYEIKWKQDFFDNVVSKRNKEYCNIHDLEYIEITDGVTLLEVSIFGIKVLNKKKF